MRKYLPGLFLFALALAGAGCEPGECTPRQHFEIMQEIRTSAERIVDDCPRLPFYTYQIDCLLGIGVSKVLWRNHLIRSARNICRLHDVSYRAFDVAHQRWGLLGLSYTREVRMDLSERWKYRDRFSNYRYLHMEDRIISQEDMTYDLGLNTKYTPRVVFKLDRDGNTSIDGLDFHNPELDSLIRDWHRSHGDIIVWDIRTDPEVKTRHVFDLMDRILGIMYTDSRSEPVLFNTKMTFSQTSDSPHTRIERRVGSVFYKDPVPGLRRSIDYLIHLTPSGEILLNGARQASVDHLIENLKAQHDIGKRNAIFIVVDDEVPWCEAMEIDRRLQHEYLLTYGGYRRKRDLERLKGMIGR